MNIYIGREVVLRLAAAIALFAYGGSAGIAHAQADSGQWQYSLTPYLWLPTIDGALNYGPPPGGGGSPDIEVGPTDWLDLLNFGALVSASATKGRFTVFTDIVYLSMSTKDSRVTSVDDSISIPGVRVPIPIDASLNMNTKTDFDGLMWMISGGYAVKETETVSMDVFVGVRFFGTEAKSSWNLTADIMTPGGSVILPAQGGTERDTDLWDGIVGIRGQSDLSAQNWAVEYYLDIGTGSSEVTWQAMGGLAYTFGWGDLIMRYRHLEYDQRSSGLMQNFSFTGPEIGARFSF